MIEFLLASFAFAGTATAALVAYFRYQGDCNICIDAEAARDFVVKAQQQEITCRCLLPVVNQGKQQGMLLNVYCQPFYCGKIMEQLEIIPHFRLLREPLRKNGYWEAVIIKKQNTHTAELEVTLRSQVELQDLLKEVPRLNILIHYQSVGRSGIQWRVAEIKFDLHRLKQGKGERICPSK